MAIINSEPEPMVITLNELRDLPFGDTASYSAHTEQEAKDWASRHGAKTVYVYRHLTGHYTAWIMLGPEYGQYLKGPLDPRD